MAEQILKAATNANKANELVAQALADPQEETTAKIVSPINVIVDLPGGMLSAGEVIKTAEVRELNGRDEEAIIRASNPGRMFATIINRAVVALGNQKPTEDMLDNLLVGDRDAILLGVYRATFGDTAELAAFCDGCKDYKTVGVDIVTDIKSKVLLDPANQLNFTVKGKSHEFLVTLPTGVTQKKLLADPDMNPAESMTALLEQTVLEIDGRPVYSKSQIQALGLVDRRAIAEEISDRNPGPQFDPITVTCPDCESEVQVPISLGTLFRF
jgi:hypothetical protein